VARPAGLEPVAPSFEEAPTETRAIFSEGSQVFSHELARKPYAKGPRFERMCLTPAIYSIDWKKWYG
jgi:hypothetical protein